jgi:predicted ATPase
MTTDPVTRDRITELRFRGLRTLDNVRLRLGSLTVLIGENGVGKSSIAEACVLIGKLARETFLEQFNLHGGFLSLMRRGAGTLGFGIRLEGAEDPIEYDIEFSHAQGRLAITSEALRLDKSGSMMSILSRQGNRGEMFDMANRTWSAIKIEEGRPLVSGFGVLPPHPALPRLIGALQDIEVHVPFMTSPEWVGRSLRTQAPLRQSTVIEGANRLEMGGLNLANAFHTLRSNKSPKHFERTMEYVRLGLGDDVESIESPVDPGGGRIGLALRRVGAAQAEPAFTWSDGMLSYLAFVALFRLEAPAPLLVFDEPEVHLHPHLLQRVIGFFDAMGERTNVLICTHSDRLLDALPDPAAAARLMELDATRAVRIIEPDADVLKRWLEKYSGAGLGTLRAEGLEPVVFPKHPR